ncbi:MAG: ABC transporter permease [Candidatus Limnocylindrales bacterium]
MTAITARLRRPAPSRVPRSRLHPADLLGIGAVGLRVRKVRSALTAIGIAIGIAAMVAVVAVSESSRADLLAALDRLGTNLLTVSPGQSFLNGEVSLPEEAPSMIERITPVEAVSAIASIDATVRRTDHIPETRTGGIGVVAADLDLLDTLRATVHTGRWLDAATERYPAVVLGWTAAERLGVTSPGVRIWMADQWFTVAGILDSFELAPNLDASVFIGFPVAEERLGHDGTASTIFVRSVQAYVEDVQRVLGRTANPEDPSGASVSRPSDALEARAEAATAFTALLVGLGAVALIVGGVGIANVMLMSVLERRTEIGLRRALGARRGHVTLQFLSEALILALIGGVLGVTLGSAISMCYAVYTGLVPVVPPIAVAGGLGSALVIGAVAGLYPAWRAARVSPTEALRGG